MNDARARIPRVDALLAHDAVADLPWGRRLKKQAIAAVLDAQRERLRKGEAVDGLETVAARVADQLATWTAAAPRRVLNATGVLLHTNLGRAPLPAAALEAIEAAAGTCDLELDLATGRRGSRFSALAPLLRAATGAEASHVVNNGAAALLLACTALGSGGVALSRGQMVEIGDSFRVAEMAAAGGVGLRELGATNKTHLRDYEATIDGGASMLLWVHRSNFTQDGFVAEPSLRELAALAAARGVALVADLGSGCLGGEELGGEPTIEQVVREGAHLVTCSGDKLLGGPQTGLLCGGASLVERCRRHPMARALRPGKTTLAALHATLRAHVREGSVDLPLHRMLRADLESLRKRAASLAAAVSDIAEVATRDSTSTVGGGALPGSELPSVALSLSGGARLAAELRAGHPPVVGRVAGGQLLLDLRGVEPADDESLACALRQAIGRIRS